MSIKCGAAVEVRGHDMNGATVWHAAKVIRQTKGRTMPPGWLRVRFIADGASLGIHESNLREAVSVHLAVPR